jgi:hypothetical protein
MRLRLHVFGIVALLPLVACVGTGTSANRESAEYQAGYSDGCATGSSRASRLPQEPQRNADLYEANADYRAGWASGYNVCGAGSNPGRF